MSDRTPRPRPPEPQVITTGWPSDRARACAFGNPDWVFGAIVMVVAVFLAAAVVVVVGLKVLGWM